MEKCVEAAGGKIHIYSYGGGPVTVVFLSGSGVPFPQIEYWDFSTETIFFVHPRVRTVYTNKRITIKQREVK